MPSITGYTCYRLYGGPGDSDGRHEASPPTQTQAEVLQVSTSLNNRRFRGPKMNGHYCIHGRNVTASGATSTLTVWYSCMPDPDPADDTHWVQDANITAVDLTAANTSFLINAGNVYAEWIRIKPSVVTSAGSLWLYIRAEGSQIR